MPLSNKKHRGFHGFAKNHALCHQNARTIRVKEGTCLYLRSRTVMPSSAKPPAELGEIDARIRLLSGCEPADIMALDGQAP